MRRVLDLTRETIEAQATPRTIAAATLDKYAGEYEGGRTLTVQSGRLMYSQGRRSAGRARRPERLDIRVRRRPPRIRTGW
jgi:hypothetical protein